jgi:predicted dehydrogenase
VTEGLDVAIVGCGLIGHKRAAALRPCDRLVGCFDIAPGPARHLAATFGTAACGSLDDLLGLGADVVVVATLHRDLASISCAALDRGAHVLVEKPAGIGVSDVDCIAAAADRAGKLVKVGFNHRFFPGITRSIIEARSGVHGEVMFARGLYGHGGRLGYESEWRADQQLAGGGEVVDQGMHLLDLSYWLFGELPVRSSMLRTNFWPTKVDDNAVLILGTDAGVGDSSPWALLHASWTEWKNCFSFEIYCRNAKLAVDGLTRSYGAQRLRIYTMRPEMGPPDLEEVQYAPHDPSWSLEWEHFVSAVGSRDPATLLGDLSSARYAWRCVEAAQGR